MQWVRALGECPAESTASWAGTGQEVKGAAETPKSLQSLMIFVAGMRREELPCDRLQLEAGGPVRRETIYSQGKTKQTHS